MSEVKVSEHETRGEAIDEAMARGSGHVVRRDQAGRWAVYGPKPEYCACGEPRSYVCKHGQCKNCGNCWECEAADRKWEGV